MSPPALHLVDGHSYAYRAFYGLPRLSNHRGQPTQAVYGFAVFLHRLLKEFPRDDVVVAFDAKGPTFRHDVFAEYKGTRKPMPDDLRTQLPILRDLVAAHGLPQITQEGVEADDVLATLAHLGAQAGRPVRIYSGDKDILQLVGGPVRVLIPRAEDVEIDPAAVEAKWGVPPARITDLLALMGDDSDNLPGVDGIGEKTGAALLRQFGSLDDLFTRLGEVKQEKLREKIRSARAQILKVRELAVLRHDVPVAGGLAGLRRERADPGRLQALYEDLEFTRLIPQLAGIHGGFGTAESAPSAAPAAANRPASRGKAGGKRAETDDAQLELLTTPRVPPDSGERAVEGLPRDALRALEASDRIALAVVDTGHRRWLAAGCAAGNWVVPAEPAALAPLLPVLADPGVTKSALDGKAVARLAQEAGGGLAGLRFDVTLAAGLLGRRARPVVDEGDAPERAVAALVALAEQEGELGPLLDAQAQRAVLDTIELPVTGVLAAMEIAGVGLDAARLDDAAREIRSRLADLEREVHALAGGAFNLLSPKQVGEVLFVKLKLPAKRKTKTGYSTDEAVLEELAAGHPAPAAILEYRKLSKLLGTYLEPLPGLARDGRLHTTWHQLGAATGRISSSDPNLQNIPVRGPWGQRIRAAFVPGRRGVKLLSCDYSQVELRILAHLADDAPLKEAFRRGEDVHAATAADMFRASLQAVTPDQRRAAKAVNFGILYGMTAYGLSRELKCDPPAAQAFLDRHAAAHPAIRKWTEETLLAARERGYVETLFGRRRGLPEIAADLRMRREAAEREALNHPVQGTAADLLKIAMARVATQVSGARLLLTIHDELLFEVPAAKAEALAAHVRAVMEGVADLAVPLVATAAWGDSWAACHP